MMDSGARHIAAVRADVAGPDARSATTIETRRRRELDIWFETASYVHGGTRCVVYKFKDNNDVTVL